MTSPPIYYRIHFVSSMLGKHHKKLGRQPPHNWKRVVKNTFYSLRKVWSVTLRKVVKNSLFSSASISESIYILYAERPTLGHYGL